MLTTGLLSPELDVLRQRTLQPSESIYACLQTTDHEAIILTSARIIILKDASKTANRQAGGRYFPLASVERLEPHNSLFGTHLVVVTPETANERPPFDLSKCSFAVSFRGRDVRDQILELAANQIRQQHLTAIQARTNGPLTPIAIASIFPQPGEHFYFAAPAALYAEQTYRQYTGGSQGVSFRIMRGVYYRVGGTRGHAVNRSQIVEDDRGQIALSNRRLVFAGTRKTVDVDYSKIAGITPSGEDGLRINISNKPALHFVCPDASAYFMLQRLMHNPP